MIQDPQDLEPGTIDYDTAEQRLLHNLYKQLNTMLKDIDPALDLTKDYHIPEPICFNPLLNQQNVEQTQNERQVHVERLNHNVNRLNPEQLAAFHAITNALRNRTAGTFFIDGPGGTGKSFLYSTLISFAINNNFNPLVMATTGIAASQLGGVTLHRAFSIPIPCTDESVSHLRTQSIEAQRLKQTDIFLIDEITQCPKQILELIDRFLRDVTGHSDLPFGGKIIVLGGDFRQCLPVLPGGSSAQILHATIKSSSLWPLFSENTFTLTVNQRSENQEFSDWLMDIGNGITQTVDLSQVPINIVHTVDDLIHSVYGNHLDINNLHTFHSTMIISPKNKQVNEINNKVLDMINTYSQVSLSTNDPIVDGNHPVIPEEIIETLHPAGLPPHKLILKIGACYMLLRNLNLKRGLCNGSRIVITSLGNKVVTYDLLNIDGSVREQNILLPRITLTPSQNYPFMFKRNQYPIVPAYAASIHKVQGCTLQKQGIYLAEPMFTHGQLYVALSRAKNFQNITVLLEKSQTRVRNEVWTSILQREIIQPDISDSPFTGPLLDDEQVQTNLDPSAQFLDDDFLQFYSGGGHVSYTYCDDLSENSE